MKLFRILLVFYLLVVSFETETLLYAVCIMFHDPVCEKGGYCLSTDKNWNKSKYYEGRGGCLTKLGTDPRIPLVYPMRFLDFFLTAMYPGDCHVVKPMESNGGL